MSPVPTVCQVYVGFIMERCRFLFPTGGVSLTGVAGGCNCSWIEVVCNKLLPALLKTPGNAVHVIGSDQLSLSKKREKWL